MLETLTTQDLSEQLNALSVDQLYQLIPALSGRLYCFPDKHTVYNISGVTREQGELNVHFTDSVLCIDHHQLPVSGLSSKMRDDLTQAINLIS